MLNLDNIKYVIAQKYYGNKNNYDFVNTLAHEFAGKKEVIGYLDLKNALHFDTKNKAEDILKSQPAWVQKHHIIIPFKKNIGDCYLLNEDDIKILTRC